MTVGQMALLSRVFLAFMFMFLILVVVLYFTMDIRKAWQIITGANITVPAGKAHRREQKKKENKKSVKRKTNAEISTKPNDKTAVLENSSARQNSKTEVLKNETQQLSHETAGNDTYEECGATAVLSEGAETAVLSSQPDKTNCLDIILDITYIHTSVTV